MKTKLKLFLYTIIFILFSSFLQSCKIKVHLDDNYKKETSFISSVFRNTVEFDVDHCRYGHLIRCEVDGNIKSSLYSRDKTGTSYPIHFLLEDHAYCPSNHQLELNVPIECSDSHAEYVQAYVTCFDETNHGAVISSPQSNYIKFTCTH